MPTPSHRWSVVLFGLVFPSVVTWVYFRALSGQAAGLQQSAYLVGKLIQFGLPAIWCWRYCREEFRRGPVQRADVWLGIGFGLLVLIATFALYHGLLKPFPADVVAAIREKVTGVGIDGLGKYVALGLFYAVCHSLLEEYYWRWFVFGQLQRLLPLGVAILISGLGFMAHHVIVLTHYFPQQPWAAWGLSACVAVGGFVWAWLYHRAGSLVPPWISHAVVDAAIFIVGYDVIRGLW